MKTRTICSAFIVTAFICVLSAPAQTFQNKDSERILERGLKNCNNSKFDLADRDFDELIQLEPESPVGYWKKADNAFARLRFEQGAKDEPKISEDQYRVLVSGVVEKEKGLIDKGLEKADLNITRNEDVGFNRYVAARLLGLKAVFQKGAGMSRVTVALTGKKMREYARQSDYQDAKFLLAFANLKLDEQPRYVKWLLKGFGEKIPPRNESLLLMYSAAENNHGPFVDDIWFVIFSQTKDNPSPATEAVYEYLKLKYPDNESLLKYEASHKASKNKKK